MKITIKLAPLAVLAVALAAASPVAAAENLIVNGSFENGFTGFTHANVPNVEPGIVIDYNSNADYAHGGASGELVAPDDTGGSSPDGAGSHAAYFLSDIANNESLDQLTYLRLGYYEIGFSAYLPHNGMSNVNDGQFVGSVIQVPLAVFAVSTGTETSWTNYTGVAHVLVAGYYQTSFSFTAFGVPAKDVIVDRVYVVSTAPTENATELSNPTLVPEPEAWVLMLAGFSLVGFSLRRRRRSVLA